MKVQTQSFINYEVTVFDGKYKTIQQFFGHAVLHFESVFNGMYNSWLVYLSLQSVLPPCG